MEKEIVWTDTAVTDVQHIVSYLQQMWPEKVLDNFYYRLQRKINSLKAQPNIGFKSAKYSRFRQTILTRQYKLIYSVKRDHIVIFKIKNTKMK